MEELCLCRANLSWSLTYSGHVVNLVLNPQVTTRHKIPPQGEEATPRGLGSGGELGVECWEVGNCALSHKSQLGTRRPAPSPGPQHTQRGHRQPQAHCTCGDTASPRPTSYM